MSRAASCLLVAFVLAGCVEEEVAVPESPPSSMDLIYQGPPEAPAYAGSPAMPRARVAAPEARRPAHIIRTCRAPDGALSFQDSPCAAGSIELSQRVVEPESPDAARRAAESQAAAINDARRVAEIAYGPSVRRSSSRQVAYDDREARCEAARVQAKKIRDHRNDPEFILRMRVQARFVLPDGRWLPPFRPGDERFSEMQVRALRLRMIRAWERRTGQTCPFAT